jgi:uncharacterized protein CbrC (UPF0167 family)
LRILFNGLVDVPLAVVEEVAYRTPGFRGWQQDRQGWMCVPIPVIAVSLHHGQAEEQPIAEP